MGRLAETLGLTNFSSMTSAPFYQDWQFWSAIVATVALLLSQLPPLHILFRRAGLKCEAFSRIHLTHRIGNPNAQWHLIIENTGGKPVRVKSIALQFRRNGSGIITLQAQSYLRTPDAQETVIFTPFRVGQSEEWAHVINFFNLFSRDDEKEFRRIDSAMRSDILSKREALIDKSKDVTTDPRILDQAMAFFNRHFAWEHGEYEVTLKVTTDNQRADIERPFRFTLLESECLELRSYTEAYQFGAGVFFNTPAHTGILVPTSEK